MAVSRVAVCAEKVRRPPGPGCGATAPIAAGVPAPSTCKRSAKTDWVAPVAAITAGVRTISSPAVRIAPSPLSSQADSARAWTPAKPWMFRTPASVTS